MSRAEQFDRLDFDLDDDEDDVVQAVVPVTAPSMQQELSVLADRKSPWMWPINPKLITGLGDSVMALRPKVDVQHDWMRCGVRCGIASHAQAGGQIAR